MLDGGRFGVFYMFDILLVFDNIDWFGFCIGDGEEVMCVVVIMSMVLIVFVCYGDFNYVVLL